MMAAKQRLRESSSWYPFPCLISFFLVLLLTAHVVLNTNPRAGHAAAVLPLAAEETEDSVIWLSLTSEDGKIIVADNYRRVFSWSEEVQTIESLEAFVTHLKTRVNDEKKAAALSKRIYQSQSRVILAVDQKLKYRHFRPILYALAEAGISNYGFETINLHDEKTTAVNKHALRPTNDNF
jgi:biopolymer transport protein ExbD